MKVKGKLYYSFEHDFANGILSKEKKKKEKNDFAKELLVTAFCVLWGKGELEFFGRGHFSFNLKNMNLLSVIWFAYVKYSWLIIYLPFSGRYVE